MKMIVLTIFTALAIAGVAGYFSIVGLAALFAAAFWPVVVMASTLELGKLVATSWIYQSWNYSPKLVRYPMILMVGALMLITSMGIYGFLSKGHLDIQGPIDQQKIELSAAKSDVQLIRERIASIDEETANYRLELKQLQAIIDGYPKNWPTKKSQKLEEQRPRRDAIHKGIEENRKAKQEQLHLLREKNKTLAGIQSELTKQEGDLGPIKYVAEVLGINPDQGVRFVILLIIFAFDPLAVLLILAANISIANKYGRDLRGFGDLMAHKKGKKKEPEPEIPPFTEKVTEIQPEPEPEVVPEPEPEPPETPEEAAKKVNPEEVPEVPVPEKKK